MKRFAVIALLFGLFCPDFSMAGPLESFSGLILPDRPETSFFLLLKNPKKLLFQLSDSKGNPLPDVKVTELTLTSNNSISLKNPQGLVTADLPEAGIYEIKIRATRNTGPQIGFNLRIFDQGPPSLSDAGKTPLGSSTFQKSPPPEKEIPPILGIAPDKPASTTVFPPIPSPGGAPMGVFRADSNPASLPLSIPASPPTMIPPAGKEPIASTTRSTASGTSSTTPDQVKPVKGSGNKSEEPGSTIGTKTNQIPKKPDPAPTASSSAAEPAREFFVSERAPQGPGFADPFRPVEVRFNLPYPGNAPLEKIVGVSLLDSTGKESPVSGQAYPIGANGIGFASSKLEPGVVYYVSVFHPVTLKPLETFKFQTLPEIKISFSEENGELIVALDWKPKAHLIPTEESQVVRLDKSSVKLFSFGIEIFSFYLTSDLAPSGSLEGVNYSARPFHFEIRLPKSKFPQASDEISAGLQVTLCGKPQPIEVAKAKLRPASTASSALPIGSEAATATVRDLPTFQKPPDPPPGGEPKRVDSTGQIFPTKGDTSGEGGATATHPVPAPFPTDGEVGRFRPDGEVFKAQALPLSATGTSSPPKETASKTRTITLTPVVPCENPGPSILLEWKSKFSATENEAGKNVSWPKGLRWNSDGSLWVADSQARRILSFDNNGTLISAFGKKGKGPGYLGMPIDLALHGNLIYISDPSTHNIHVFGKNGNPVRDIGVWGVKPGQLDLPHGLEIASDQLWISDRGNCRISRYSLEGTYRGGFGERGELPGFLNQPVSIRFSGDNLWVMDCEPIRLQKFGPDGKFLGKIPLGSVKEASAIDIDPWGYIWIAGGESHQVIRMDATGKVLLTLPGSGEPEPTDLELTEASENEKKPWVPTAISVRNDGTVAIADGVSRSIHLYKTRR